MIKNGPETEEIAVRAESGYLSHSYWSNVTLCAEFLAAVNIGEMDLDYREKSSGEGITNGDAGVGECGGVDEYAVI